MVRYVFASLVCASILASMAGCGDGARPSNRPATAKAKATVTYKGQPVEGANVTLSPDDASGKPASGRTGADGVAKLRTFEVDDGAVPGAYKVSVTKTDAPAAGASGAGGAAPTGDAYTQAFAKAGGPKGDAAAKAKDLLPAKYKSSEGSGLTAMVKAGEDNNFKFELTD